MRVIDGATVKIDDNGRLTNVRLIGVDTPGTVHPNKPNVNQTERSASVHVPVLLSVLYQEDTTVWRKF